MDGILESLPALNAISGCNSVSAVNGKWKAKWSSTAQKKEQYLQSRSQLEDTIRINIDIPSSTGHGWEKKDNQLSVVWMENHPVPESVLRLITCTCRKWNCTNSCQCRVLSVECTDVCKCWGLCGNIYDSVKSDNDEAEEDNENDNADNNI